MKGRGYWIFVLILWGVIPSVVFAKEVEPAPHRLPEGVIPVLGCWFWTGVEFEPEGYREFIDLVSDHSPYNLLTTSLRVPLKEVTDPDVRDQIKSAVEYGREHGVGIVMDLDVRLARRAFQKTYPNELQQMLRLREVKLSATGEVDTEIHSQDLTDHYTHRTTHYIPLRGTLVRVYSYIRNASGIEPDSLLDVTDRCAVPLASKEMVKVTIPCSRETAGRRACVMVAFTHLAPAVFAPHLIPFQRGILQRYADVPLAGVCKDEWGFPPCYDGNPEKNDYWYSPYRAEAYAKRTGGRDLVADCLLMYLGIRGRERERIMAINHFMEMSWRRNGDIENAFYHATKKIFGPRAMVSTHPTWWPYPDLREFKKNGLDWWVATRDWAQTDEVTPFAVRTALAKKWASPVWFNMYYSSQKSDYERNVWTYALAGGRINYHPLWPRSGPLLDRSRELLRGKLMRAESRVRLLNFITRAPLDCPVAIIFGHTCAMNWAGPAYNDVGMALVNALWRAGYPTDLIPSSEIENNNLQISKSCWIQYGLQDYAAVVLFHPEFEKPITAQFFQEAAQGKTKLFRVGNWTMDFDGRLFDGNAALPESMNTLSDTQSVLSEVCKSLSEQNISPQTPATLNIRRFDHVLASPPREGFCRLIDGTIVWVAGTTDPAGDSFDVTMEMDGHKVQIDATGVAAVRLRPDGTLAALAAGGLKQCASRQFKLTLKQRTDIVLWRDIYGKFHGVVQGLDGPIPEALESITRQWRRLSIPPPVTPQMSGATDQSP